MRTHPQQTWKCTLTLERKLNKTKQSMRKTPKTPNAKDMLKEQKTKDASNICEVTYKRNKGNATQQRIKYKRANRSITSPPTKLGAVQIKTHCKQADTQEKQGYSA